ncbi:MAG: DUF937 domain-containing protein, partial [Candidatus Binatia bacterium]
LNDLAARLGGGSATAGVISSGADITQVLFGGKVRSIIDLIGRSVGMKSSVVSSLLSIAAPIVMGALQKEKEARGLGVAGLTTLLTRQRNGLSHVAPAGLESLRPNDGAAAGQRFAQAPGHEAPRAMDAAAAARLSDWWLLPVLALATLALLVYFFWPRGAVIPDATMSQREVKSDNRMAIQSPPLVPDSMLTAGATGQYRFTLVRTFSRED